MKILLLALSLFITRPATANPEALRQCRIMVIHLLSETTDFFPKKTSNGGSEFDLLNEIYEKYKAKVAAFDFDHFKELRTKVNSMTLEINSLEKELSNIAADWQTFYGDPVQFRLQHIAFKMERILLIRTIPGRDPQTAEFSRLLAERDKLLQDKQVTAKWREFDALTVLQRKDIAKLAALKAQVRPLRDAFAQIMTNNWVSPFEIYLSQHPPAQSETTLTYMSRLSQGADPSIVAHYFVDDPQLKEMLRSEITSH